MRKNYGAKPFSYPQPVFIIAAYDENGLPNAMNAAWGGISEMKEISICISEGHKTTANILKRKAFTVSMAEVGQVVACDYVGIVSGNKVTDKFARAGFHAARSAFYPSLTLSGSIGWTNNVGGVVVNPGSWLFSAVGSLMQPLFNKGTNIANLRQAKARQEEALLLFQQSLLDAGKEVNNALTRWQSARIRMDYVNQQIMTLQEAVRKTELLMQHTSTNYLEVLTARQRLLEAELTQAQDKFEEIQGVIDLYHAVGGR